MIQDVGNDKVFKIFIDAYKNPSAIKLCGVVVQIMKKLLLFKFDLKKILLIVKLARLMRIYPG